MAVLCLREGKYILKTKKIMKKIFLIAVIAFSASMIFAQQETLFRNASVRGAFGGPIWEMGLTDNVKPSYGGGGGIIINNIFLGGYGLASLDVEKLIIDQDVEKISLAHGGFWLGATYAPYKLLHIYGTTRIGWGALDIKDNSPSYWDLDRVFVLTPEIGAELNITSWMHLTGTIGYRYLSGANEDNGYTSKDFSGAVASISLRFGWFGWRRWGKHARD